MLNGQTLAENQAIELPVAQLGSLSYDSGSGSALEWARAFDGFQWSAWQSFPGT